MLQLILARGDLLCGFGNSQDPGRDPSQSGLRGDGCRPSIFFGPHRDALHLITRRLHTAIILKKRMYKDLETRVWVFPLPGGHPDTAAAWFQQVQNSDLRAFVSMRGLEQSSSRLEYDADIYHQEFQAEAAQPFDSLSLRVESLVEDDCLRESWQLNGWNPKQFDAWLLSWHEPEIAASRLFQCTLFHDLSRTLCSYRGSVFFGIQAARDGESLPVAFVDCGSEQGQKASTRFGDILRSLWAREELMGSGIASGLQTLPIGSRSRASIGATDGLIVWAIPGDGRFELRHRLAGNLDDLSRPLPDIQQSAARIRAADQAWLERRRPAPAALRHDLKNLYSRTLLTLRQMQDPGGGLIAAPEFHYELTQCGGYGFCWGRDAAFIAYAMDACGMHDESRRFYRYVAACQSEDGSFLHRFDMQGRLAASWGLLQADEGGSILFGLRQHIRLSEDTSLAVELRPMLDKAANWLVHARHDFDEDLPIAGHDLWEEREGVHLYSVAAMSAGLQAAVEIYQSCGWEAPVLWAKRARELRELCRSPRFILRTDEAPLLARTLHRRVSVDDTRRAPDLLLRGGEAFLPQDTAIDASLAGLIFPFKILDESADHALIKALVQKIFERLWRSGQGGIGRYEGDRYREGNPWMLTTLWLALAAESCPDLARKAWDWTLDHISAEGLLPEQIDPRNGGAAWVMPLAWSHAMFALAIQQLPAGIVR